MYKNNGFIVVKKRKKRSIEDAIILIFIGINTILDID